MKQNRRQQVSIQFNMDPRIDNARQVRCWRCNRRLFDYNEAVYEFLRLMANNVLVRTLSTDGKIEIVRTRCDKCNAYNSLSLNVEEARPPRARDHPMLMVSAHG